LLPELPENLEAAAEEVRRNCLQALAAPYFQELEMRLQHSGQADDACVRAIAAVNDELATLEPMKRLLTAFGGEIAGGIGERFLVLKTILRSLPSVSTLNVAGGVKRYFYESFQDFAVNEASHAWCRAGRFSFVVICKKATLRIFPGGEFYWEISGFPRSWLKLIPPRSLSAALLFFATKFKGFAPAFFFHLDPGRRVRALSPATLNACYLLMAECLELQPEIKGILTIGWLHSPDTHAISPHLAWRNQAIAENGGFVSRINGPVEHELVFHRSPERRKAFEAGRFTPTNGLVLWASADMRKWAAAQRKAATGTGT